MSTQDSEHEQDHANNSSKAIAATFGQPRFRRTLDLATHWAQHHAPEIFWALVFAVLAGYAFALYIEEPSPYTIYVVVDQDTDGETMQILQTAAQKADLPQIGRVKTRIQIEKLPDQDGRAAAEEARKLVSRTDTLLVIEHGRSQNVESSIRTYLGARPQVPVITTVATDDDLLRSCRRSAAETSGGSEGQDRVGSCFNGYWFNSLTKSNEEFAPLLQLSPTNEVQGRSAVQFAIQNGKRRFLIVLGSDPRDQSYTDNMTKAYSDAIHAAHAELKGVVHLSALPSESDLESWMPDCVLYAGGIGEAQTVFRRLSAMSVPNMPLTAILSDSVIQSRGMDTDLAAFGPAVPQDEVLASRSRRRQRGPVEAAVGRERLRPGRQKNAQIAALSIPVNFTYQTDAYDYNIHANPYIDDAFSVAAQLIGDLNVMKGDVWFRIKSSLHVHNVEDARRNLVEVMRQNSTSRTWYQSTSQRTPYVFDGHKPYGGMFHVWRLSPSSPSGKEMDDIDNWHPPRVAPATAAKATTTEGAHP